MNYHISSEVVGTTIRQMTKIVNDSSKNFIGWYKYLKSKRDSYKSQNNIKLRES